MPGDKSISHRAAMIAALANGTSRIKNFSNSADCAATLFCLRQLGVGVEIEGSDVLIAGGHGLRAPDQPLDCGNSGTTMRLLAGILAGQGFESVLTGDDSLRSRPMQRIIEPLQMMGASVSSPDGHAPITIHGRSPLRPISYELKVASAQVKSGILFAGLNADGRTEVIEDQVTRDHTERMLRWFGVPVETKDGTCGVDGPARFSAHEVSIPGDISSAAYFIAAAAMLPGSTLELLDVGLNSTRGLFLKQLRSFGFDVRVEDAHEDGNEPLGTLNVSGTKVPLKSDPESMMSLRGELIPQLIDELPLLAVIGSQLDGGIEIRDAAELRVKESDRISTTVDNLRAMGAVVEEYPDGLRVHGSTRLEGASIDPRGDHRIAMAFTVAGLIARSETEIEEAGCVAVSFPGFFELLESVVER